MFSNPKKVLRDGEVFRVPLTMMDGVQRAIASLPQSDAAVLGTEPPVVDAFGNPAGYRPGYVYPLVTDAARVTAYELYKQELADAWKTKP